MNTLYLKEGGQGVGNLFLNIVLILIWMLTTNKYDKFILILDDRQDAITNYCKPIHNDKIEIITSKEFNLKMEKKISSIKTFLKSHYSDVMNNVSNCTLDTKFRNPYIALYGCMIPKKEELILVKNYFNPELTDELKEKVEKLKETMFNNEKYIALHVRGTDHITCAMNTTEDKVSYNDFYDFIDKYQSEYKYIYVATDDDRIKKKFIDKYGNKLSFYESICEPYKMGNSVRFTTAESIYIDTFICRDADRFLGTPKSTFSDFIKLLRFNRQY